MKILMLCCIKNVQKIGNVNDHWSTNCYVHPDQKSGAQGRKEMNGLSRSNSDINNLHDGLSAVRRSLFNSWQVAAVFMLVVQWYLLPMSLCDPQLKEA